MYFQRCIACVLAGCFTAALIGCGSSDGKLTVEGTATWNGQPIEDGYVEVSPASGPGQVDGADIVGGKFSLRTSEGEKRVSIVARRKIGETEPTERIPTPEPIYFQYLPKQFNDNTELTRTVTASEPALSLDLTGEERSPRELANTPPR